MSLRGNKIITTIINREKLSLQEYYQELNCRTIDIVNLNENIAIICDDEGLLLPDNPVFSIKDGDGNKREIAGAFLLAKDIMTKDGLETKGFIDIKEAMQLMGQTEVGVIYYKN